ncbi:MAG: AmmeMemoRadiSam system protein B [Methylomicrobium sp.]
MNRRPAVAGLFYPDDPVELRNMVDQYLNDAESGSKVPKAIIAPHAGYIYSGPVAASAYARLKQAENPIERVVLLGPSHRVAFRGLAVSRAKFFRTPLGDVPIDREAVETLLNLPFVEYIEQAHTYEHSLEVHLPFLQETLSDFKLVPIVAGDASAEQVGEALEMVWGGPETLIVISSDLSHYHDYATAQKLDRQTSQLIETMAYEKLSSDAACGKVPVSGLLKLLRQKAMTIKVVDLRNSGDTAGDKNRVVGYGAYVVD